MGSSKSCSRGLLRPSKPKECRYGAPVGLCSVNIGGSVSVVPFPQNRNIIFTDITSTTHPKPIYDHCPPRYPARMFRLRPVFLLVILFAILPLTTNLSAQPKPASKQATIERFFHLREQMLDQRGTEAQVEELMGLLSDDASYEHPAFGVKMDKADARAGMIAHLKEGRDAKITVHRMLVGPDFAVAETTLHYSVPDKDGSIKAINRNGVAVFQFEGDRVSRVAEY